MSKLSAVLSESVTSFYICMLQSLYLVRKSSKLFMRMEINSGSNLSPKKVFLGNSGGLLEMRKYKHTICRTTEVLIRMLFNPSSGMYIKDGMLNIFQQGPQNIVQLSFSSCLSWLNSFLFKLCLLHRLPSVIRSFKDHVIKYCWKCIRWWDRVIYHR